MDWVFLILGSVCFVEIFIRLDSLSHIKKLNNIIGTITRVLTSSRISDHWKEKVLPRYAFMLFKQSMLIFAVLVASFCIFPILGLISNTFGGRFFALSTSVTGVAVSTCAALAYALLRAGVSPKTGDYSAGSKFLHHISLGTPFIGEALFDIEKSVFPFKSPDITHGNHVFVCGLARAGTTVIMRSLYESNQFVSLTYRDMPFVLAPNLWRKLNRLSSKSMDSQERAHGDGLMVDYDSPEALEEVFWKKSCGRAYIREDCLVPMTAPEEVLDDFRHYVSLVLGESGKQRYLSKNNNNILRLGSVSAVFPNAVTLIPFRRPEQQAYSLMRQHQRFVQLHATDHFSRKYMTWLVHHEFGADHRPFRFNGEQPKHHDPDILDYWLEIWLRTYSFLADNMTNQAHLVCYETLCENSEHVWDELASIVQLPDRTVTLEFSGSHHPIDYSFDSNLMAHAGALYDRLRAQSIGWRNA